MKFNQDGVEIPSALLAALRDDALVVFVGAGASARAYPGQKRNTYYPDFIGLVREIGSNLEFDRDPEAEDNLTHGHPDRVLGEWDGDKHDVHREAGRILQQDEEKKRLDLHRALIRLFPHPSTPRIVTTNFDRLLELALVAERPGEEGFVRWQIHKAPSLPPAKRFMGICHLHGRADEPNAMVLTDKDIGRAYMDEGWALRFAHDLFRSYSVLFLGYSLDDPPLRYLTLALEGTGNKPHWVFAVRPADQTKAAARDQDWKRRGVEPIWYEARRKDYRALTRTVAAWSRENAQTFLDSRNRLISWGKTDSSSLAPHERDVARYLFQTDPLLRDFAKSNPDRSWYETLSDDHHLNRILHRKGDLRESDYPLASMLVTWILVDVDYWVGVLWSLRTSLHPILFEEFCRRIHQDSLRAITTETTLKCVELFRPTIQCSTSVAWAVLTPDLIRRLVEAFRPNEAIWIYINIIKSDIVVSRDKSFHFTYIQMEGKDTTGIEEYTTQIEESFGNPHSEYWVREILNKILLPNIESIGFPLLHSLSYELIRVRNRTQGMSKRDSSSESERKAIEAHSADSHKDGLTQFLVDALRDGIEHLIPVNPSLAESVRAMWLDSGDSLLERLAVHATRILVRRSQ